MTDRSGSKTGRIGLFGGTLDPVHLGHLRAGEEVREALRLDEIWFLPAFRPPHKVSRPLSPYSHRLGMVELAVEGVRHFRASDIEAGRPGPSYSVDTLEELKRSEDPGLFFFFIVGSDAFLEIDTWKDFSRLPLLSELVVIPRSPWNRREIVEGLLRIFTDYCEAAGEKGLFTSSRGGRIRILNTTRLEISSTDIRRRVRTGLSVRFLVPEKVRRYMISNKLYLPDTKADGENLTLQPLSSRETARRIFEEIKNNKGEDVCVLDMRGISPVADFFIISQGRSTKHVQGMANRMRRELRRDKIRCRSIEGEDEGKWVLLDFGDIIVHLFYEPVRSFYDLEGLWSEAPRVSLEEDKKALEKISG